MDLECNHCGGIAFTSTDVRNGVHWFTDGDGEECADCGFPGWVSVDEPDPDDAEVSWMCSDADAARCNRHDCDDCEIMQREAAPCVREAQER